MAGVARSGRRQASTAGKASGPGDQARPRGLKPRGAAAAAARCVPSRRQRSSRAAGDRSLSGAGDQAGGCSGLQGGDPRGGTGWYLHLGPAPVCHSVYPVRCPANAPERDVLRRSPPHWVRRRARVPYQCPVLHSAQMLAPAESILPALIHYAGCTYFGIRQYVSPFAQYTSLGASGPSPSTITSRHG